MRVGGRVRPLFDGALTVDGMAGRVIATGLSRSGGIRAGRREKVAMFVKVPEEAAPASILACLERVAPRALE